MRGGEWEEEEEYFNRNSRILNLLNGMRTRRQTLPCPNPYLILTPPVNLKYLFTQSKLIHIYIYYFRLTGTNKKCCSVWRVTVCNDCWSGHVGHYPGTTSRAMTHETRPAIIANRYAAYRTTFLVGVIGEANYAPKQ